MSERTFTFPISILIRDAKLLHAALIDTVTGPAVARRLTKKNPDATQPPTEFAPLFLTQIKLVENGGIAQSGAIGEIGTMTEEQIIAFAELEERLAAARRSAKLAFPNSDVRLRNEFQIGIHEPSDFASEMARAREVHAACQTHADALDDHGWLEEDTAALEALIKKLDGDDTEHESAKDKKKGFTKARNLAANKLYEMCRSIQNAAGLAYPRTKADNDEAIHVARNRYLLNEFPPRHRDDPEDEETPPAPLTPPVP